MGKLLFILIVSMVIVGCAPMHSRGVQSSGLSSGAGLGGAVDESSIQARGQARYTQSCAACHGEFSASGVRGYTMGEIQSALAVVPSMSHLRNLAVQDVEAVAYALSMTPQPTIPTVPPVTEQPSVNKWEQVSEKVCAPTALHRDIRILEATQYRDIVLDLFGYNLDISSFAKERADFYRPDVTSGGSGVRDLLQLDDLYVAAEKVAKHAADNIASVGARFSSCNQSDRACQDTIATSMLSRLLRRKLDSTDSDYAAIMARFASIADFKTRIRSVVTAGLMQPRFLYVVEYKKGFRAAALTADTMRTLDDHELASRLSFMIWNSAPDEELLTLAKSGTLSQLATLKAQTARMLADARAQRLARNFAEQWLDIGDLETIAKDRGANPAFSSSLMSRFKAETTAFVSAGFSQDIRKLVTSDTTYVDATLATHYGISGVSGTAMVAARRPQAELHGGIIAHGSIAARTSGDQTDPIHRGLYAYERFLCGKMGSPPADASLVVIEGTKFEQMNGRAGLASCASCHAKFEPMGYVSEMLSPLGQYRVKDESGATLGQTVRIESGANVKSVLELGQEIADDSRLGYCMSQNLTKFALKAGFVASSATQCHNENALVQAYKNGNSMKAYVEATVLSPLFTRKMESK